MRCRNCGWENPNGQTTCEKCHGRLVGLASDDKPITKSESEILKQTIAEGSVFNEPTSAVIPKTCPKCGYPVSEGFTTCPNCDYELHVSPTMKQIKKCQICGAEIAADAKFCSNCGKPTSNEPHTYQRIQRSSMGTVIGGPVSSMSSFNQFCTLKPIAWDGEDVNYNPITYSGSTIILNRANTDANNNSITSKEQAILTCEDGEWYIENLSTLKTTFIRVNGKIKIKTGDIIILGNRQFEFKG